MEDQKQLKILILMAYYNRPLLVKNALLSIVKANEHHQNWRLLFGDDGSIIPGKPIVQDILKDHIDKVDFVESNFSLDQKLKNGLVLGKFANETIEKSDADVAIILCDDDEIYPNYFYNLNLFFNKNTNILHCYSKVLVFNPIIQKSSDVNEKIIYNRYNQWNEPINPVGKLDASQVAWRLDCCKKHGAWFADSTKFVAGRPWTKDTDRSFFENLHERCGPCQPTGFIGQFKGIHDYQLLWHKNVTIESLKAYDEMCRKLAGEKF
jgi:glycosyltransferase involved in cell wall biosynthesis